MYKICIGGWMYRTHVYWYRGMNVRGETPSFLIFVIFVIQQLTSTGKGDASCLWVYKLYYLCYLYYLY
jgi:hypothetical protein